MKILNLDSFAKPTRSIVIDGSDHPVLDLDVQGFIDNYKAALELEKAGDTQPPTSAIEDSVRMVQRAVPSLPAERIRRFTLVQLGKVLEFIRGEFDDEAVKAAQEGASAAADASTKS